MSYVGIDFGMENLKVMYNNGKTRRKINIGSDQEAPVTPNVVFYKKNEEGKINKFFGSSDKCTEAHKIFDDDLIVHIKRKMQYKGWKKKICDDFSEVDADEVITDIFRYVNEQIYKESRESDVPAIITYPVMFSEIQKNKIIKCACKAGIKVKALITEPFAALFSGDILKSIENADDEEKYIMIFDFGGSTLDVCVARVVRGTDGVVNISLVSSAGMKYGGVDITDDIKKYIVEPKIKDVLDSVKKDRRIVDYELCDLINECKREIFEEEEDSSENAWEGKRFVISRDEIDEMFIKNGIKDKLEKLFDDMLDAVDDGLDADDITEIYAIGGSSKITFFREFIEDYFDTEPEYDESDEIIYDSVASGASRFIEKLDEFTVNTSIPLSVGIDRGKGYELALNKNSMYSEFGPAMELEPAFLESHSWKVDVYQSDLSLRKQPVDSENVYYAGYFLLYKQMYDLNNKIYLSVRNDENGIYAVCFQQKGDKTEDVEKIYLSSEN